MWTLDFDSNLSDLQWSKGAEEFKSLSKNKLWALHKVLNAIPFFNIYQDLMALHNLWTLEGQTWFQIPGNQTKIALNQWQAKDSSQPVCEQSHYVSG